MALVRSVPASSCAMRSSATSTYSSVISQPYALRPFFKAATALDPTPRYGSNTFPPGFVILRTNLSTKPTGNWQGWSVFSTWFNFTLGISQTSDGFFPSGFPDNLPLLGPLKCILLGYFEGMRTGSRLNV